MTPKEKARELVSKYIGLLGRHDGKVSQSPNIEISFIDAKQCAIIAIENEYNSLREQLYNLKSCHVIESDTVFLKRMDVLIEQEKELITEINNL